MKRLTKYVAVLAVLVLMITGVSSSVIVSNERDLSPDFSGKQAPLPSWDDYYIQNVQSFGYPDDIGGVFYDNETYKLCYLVVDRTPDRIKELQKRYGENVEFAPCKYSYTELMKVYYEILRQGESDNNLRSGGTDIAMNRIVVGVYENQLAYYRAEFAKRYGDKVFVEMVTGIPTLV